VTLTDSFPSHNAGFLQYLIKKFIISKVNEDDEDDYLIILKYEPCNTNSFNLTRDSNIYIILLMLAFIASVLVLNDHRNKIEEEWFKTLKN